MIKEKNKVKVISWSIIGAVAVYICCWGNVISRIAPNEDTKTTNNKTPQTVVVTTQATVTPISTMVSPSTATQNPSSTLPTSAPVTQTTPARGNPEPNPNPTEEEDEGSDVFYGNCTEARRAGVAPIYRGQPGYRRALDRDGDGKACD